MCKPWRKLPVASLVAGLLLLFVVTGCRADSTPPPPPTTAPATLLHVGVSDNAAPLAELWRVAFDQEQAQVAINLVEGNNTALFADLEGGELDALLVHHIPESLEDAWFNPVALDGLVIIVGADNPLASLTQAQVQGLFSGEIGSWSAVEGPEMSVAPVAQERGDGARTVFTRRIMGSRPVSINTVIQSDNAALLETVASTPGAIGYTMMGALASSADVGVKVVAIDGITPTPQNLSSQEYPLTTPLYFVSEAEPQGEMRAFLAWMQSPEGQAIVSESVGSVR